MPLLSVLYSQFYIPNSDFNLFPLPNSTYHLLYAPCFLFRLPTSAFPLPNSIHSHFRMPFTLRPLLHALCPVPSFMANPSKGKKTTPRYPWPASRMRWQRRDLLPWDTELYWAVPGKAAGESLRWKDSDVFYRKLFFPRVFLPPWSADCLTAGKYYPVPVSFRRWH